MIDHIGIMVVDYTRSLEFYRAALSPLGYQVIEEQHGWAGLGRDGAPTFWFAQGKPAPDLHLAISARDRGEVDRFYEAAMSAGARDNGPPGLREIYHPHYYGAFVLDPDGYNLEAVCHLPAS